jgi:hypothetical protein
MLAYLTILTYALPLSAASADIVGRALTASKDVSYAADEFLDQFDWEEIDKFRIMTDF